MNLCTTTTSKTFSWGVFVYCLFLSTWPLAALWVSAVVFCTFLNILTLALLLQVIARMITRLEIACILTKKILKMVIREGLVLLVKEVLDWSLCYHSLQEKVAPELWCLVRYPEFSSSWDWNETNTRQFCLLPNLRCTPPFQGGYGSNISFGKL